MPPRPNSWTSIVTKFNSTVCDSKHYIYRSIKTCCTHVNIAFFWHFLFLHIILLSIVLSQTSQTFFPSVDPCLPPCCWTDSLAVLDWIRSVSASFNRLSSMTVGAGWNVTVWLGDGLFRFRRAFIRIFLSIKLISNFVSSAKEFYNVKF